MGAIVIRPTKGQFFAHQYNVEDSYLTITKHWVKLITRAARDREDPQERENTLYA